MYPYNTILANPLASVGGSPLAFLRVLGFPFSSLYHEYKLFENPW